jgi:hypothetical protein
MDDLDAVVRGLLAERFAPSLWWARTTDKEPYVQARRLAALAVEVGGMDYGGQGRPVPPVVWSPRRAVKGACVRWHGKDCGCWNKRTERTP